MAPSSSGQDARFSTWKGGFNSLWGYQKPLQNARVAQWIRASASEAEGRRFESCRERQLSLVEAGPEHPPGPVARRDEEGCAHASLAMLRRLPKRSSRPCRERQHEPDPVRTGSVETVAQHGRAPRPGRSSVRIRPVSSIQNSAGRHPGAGAVTGNTSSQDGRSGLRGARWRSGYLAWLITRRASVQIRPAQPSTPGRSGQKP